MTEQLRLKYIKTNELTIRKITNLNKLALWDLPW
jgi:hypothetical protein